MLSICENILKISSSLLYDTAYLTYVRYDMGNENLVSKLTKMRPEKQGR